eukprot:7324731-Prymnesium_polylepis.1
MPRKSCGRASGRGRRERTALSVCGWSGSQTGAGAAMKRAEPWRHAGGRGWTRVAGWRLQPDGRVEHEVARDAAEHEHGVGLVLALQRLPVVRVVAEPGRRTAHGERPLVVGDPPQREQQ